jgi:hypothetical protein
MSNNSSRTRWAIPEPRGSFKSLVERLRSPYVWTRVALCAVAALILWVACAGWAPAFAYRVRLAPLHSLPARVPFDVIDPVATDEPRVAPAAVLLPEFTDAIAKPRGRAIDLEIQP